MGYFGLLHWAFQCCCCKEVGYLFSIIEVLPQITFDTILAWASNLELPGFFRRVPALESFWEEAGELVNRSRASLELERVGECTLYCTLGLLLLLLWAAQMSDARPPQSGKGTLLIFLLWTHSHRSLAHWNFKLDNELTISYYYTLIHNWTW